MVMMNRVSRESGSTPSAKYGHCLVETVSTGLKLFKKNVGLPDIRNVRVLVDFREQHQSSKDLWCIVRNACRSHGHFMGVGHVTMVDSAASRLMQLAELVAASRNWASKMGIGVEHLEEQCGILCRWKKPPEGGFCGFHTGPWRARVPDVPVRRVAWQDTAANLRWIGDDAGQHGSQ